MSTRQEELQENLLFVQSEIAPYSPELIVVTKTYPVEDVQILKAAGADNFGENRNEEGLIKSEAVSARWHYQGEIQSKKLRSILQWANVIHSLDSLDHAQKIDRILDENQSSIELFLQLSLDGDTQRGGLVEADLRALAGEVQKLRRINLLGIMCVPPVSMDPVRAYSEIASTHSRFLTEFPDSSGLSAGMSNDYLLALKHGATHIRIGSKILGAREYRR
jgi:pyridoxal phosphate enzyme (YggS family)